MKITLASPKQQVIVEQKTKTITSLTVTRMVDLPVQKEVRVFIEELTDPIVLWSGAAYDAIGEWTDAQVQARLTELFS